MMVTMMLVSWSPFIHNNQIWLYFQKQPFLVVFQKTTENSCYFRLFTYLCTRLANNSYMDRKIHAIITGDIVRSESIGLDKRDDLIKTLRCALEDLQRHSSMKMEIYRGDSFQIIVDNPVKSLRIASMIRTYLIGNAPEDEKNGWDARISIGIGAIDYKGESIVVSDGEAFRLSGRGLDNIEKGRLTVATCWEEVNEEVDASIGFVDNLITSLSRNQAKLLYLAIAEELPQVEIAGRTGKSQQNISKTLNAAKEPLLSRYLNRYESLIAKHCEQ